MFTFIAVMFLKFQAGPIVVPDGNLKISWNQAMEGGGAGSAVMPGGYGPLQDEEVPLPGCTYAGEWTWNARNTKRRVYLYVSQHPIGRPPWPPQCLYNVGYLTNHSNAPFMLEYTANEGDGTKTIVTITQP